jgi:hypothetical protein
MTTQHTPTPWEQFAGCGPAIFKAGVTQQIASTARLGPDPQVHAVDEANAAFIVTACNAHDELVAALRMMEEHFAWHVEHDTHHDSDLIMLQVARAALAKAK